MKDSKQLVVLVETYWPDKSIAVNYGIKRQTLSVEQKANHLEEIIKDCLSHFNDQDFERGLIIKIEYIKESRPLSYRSTCFYDTRNAEWIQPYSVSHNIFKMAASAKCLSEPVTPTSDSQDSYHLKIVS